MDGRESGGFSGDLGGAGALARSPRRITSRGARLRSPSFQLRGAGARSRSPSTVYPRGARPRSPMTRAWNATVHSPSPRREIVLQYGRRSSTEEAEQEMILLNSRMEELNRTLGHRARSRIYTADDERQDRAVTRTGSISAYPGYVSAYSLDQRRGVITTTGADASLLNYAATSVITAPRTNFIST